MSPDFTPTVGLGCRSGGYMIFFVMALANFTFEMLLWPFADGAMWEWLRRIRNHPRVRNMSDAGIQRVERWDSDKWSGGLKHRLIQLLRYWKSLNDRDRFGLLVLTPMDIGNAAWLTYIVLAQTFGWYRNCSCKGTSWGWHEGYIDFATYAHLPIGMQLAKKATLTMDLSTARTTTATTACIPIGFPVPSSPASS